MLKRDGNVYTQVVTNCKAKTLIPIEFSELQESTIYSGFWKAYDGLVDYGAKEHYRVKHTQSEFAKKPYQWDRKFLGQLCKTWAFKI